MHDIYTNSKEPEKNRFGFVFDDLAINNELRFAIPFFSKADVLEEAIKNNCRIYLIVKLGRATDANALYRLLKYEDNIKMKYFTENFHSKLYIFGRVCAFVGSSNLTRNGLWDNDEINVKIPEEDPRFEILYNTFDNYWDSPEAEWVTKEVLEEYIRLEQESGINKLEQSFESKVLEKFGSHKASSNMEYSGIKKDKKKDFIQNKLKRYHAFLPIFRQLRSIYERNGQRKVNESQLPLNIEIDQFLSWITDRKTPHTEYLHSIFRSGDLLKNYVTENINEFIADEAFNLDWIIDDSFPIFQKHLASQESIEAMNNDEIFELFNKTHSFHWGSVRYAGGEVLAKPKFLQLNNAKNIKKMLTYLLFGKGNEDERIANCIYSPEYKIHMVAQSTITELYGWANAQEKPIYNERIAKSMQWLGFGKI